MTRPGTTGQSSIKDYPRQDDLCTTSACHHVPRPDPASCLCTAPPVERLLPKVTDVTVGVKPTKIGRGPPLLGGQSHEPQAREDRILPSWAGEERQ